MKQRFLSIRNISGCIREAQHLFVSKLSGMLEETNRILVVANNTRKRTNVPCENTDWFNYGGIYRDVELIRLPETFIKDFSIISYRTAVLKRLRLYKSRWKPKRWESVLQIEELKIKTEIEIKDGFGRVILEAHPMLWSPENPKLYEVKVTYNKDTLIEKVGFREIKVKGTEIYLNGEKIFLKGICAHEESVKNGKAVTEEEIRENFRLAKEMNCNYMRLAHYPHSEKAARIADEMGIMLWEEIPVYWAIEFENPETYRMLKTSLMSL